MDLSEFRWVGLVPVVSYILSQFDINLTNFIIKNLFKSPDGRTQNDKLAQQIRNDVKSDNKWTIGTNIATQTLKQLNI